MSSQQACDGEADMRNAPGRLAAAESAGRLADLQQRLLLAESGR